MIRSFNKKSPLIDKTSYIDQSAQIIGDVIVHALCSVWPNVVIRADMDTITIAEGSNVQDGTVIHNDIAKPVFIGKNCTIGHNCILHSCSIGNNSLIGMGAILLNDVVIGHNCVIGAGAVLKEKMIIEDNCLVVGIPAVIKGTINETMVEKIYKNAIEYQKLAALYLVELSE